MRHSLVVLALVALVSLMSARAEKASVKVSDVDTADDTSITIKKGASPLSCVEYTILDGQEEVFGSPEFEKGKALKSWKEACSEWRKNLKELNTGNQVMVASCGSPTATKDGDQWMHKSTASYKIKTKIKDKN